MKKILAALLSVALLTCFLCPYVFADSIQPLWDYVTDISGTLNISSGGVASVTADGSATRRGVTNCTLIASLQQLKNGHWTELKSWSRSAENCGTSLSTKKWAVAHGYEYRLVITLEAYDDTQLLESGSGTIYYGMFD